MVYDETYPYKLVIIDRATGKPLQDVVWCDDTTGEYVQLVRDEHGRLCDDPTTGETKRRRRRGSLVVFKRED